MIIELTITNDQTARNYFVTIETAAHDEDLSQTSHVILTGKDGSRLVLMPAAFLKPGDIFTF